METLSAVFCNHRNKMETRVTCINVNLAFNVATSFMTSGEPKQKDTYATLPTEMDRLHGPFGQTHNPRKKGPES
jgi:hypothetical protein